MMVIKLSYVNNRNAVCPPFKFIASFYIFYYFTYFALWNSVNMAGGWRMSDLFLFIILFYSSLTANNAANTNFVFLCCNLIIYYELWTIRSTRVDKRLWNFIRFSFYILFFFSFVLRTVPCLVNDKSTIYEAIKYTKMTNTQNTYYCLGWRAGEIVTLSMKYAIR